MGKPNPTSLARAQRLREGMKVRAICASGTEHTGELDSIEVNLSNSSNPYVVHFKDGYAWNTRAIKRVE